MAARQDKLSNETTIIYLSYALWRLTDTTCAAIVAVENGSGFRGFSTPYVIFSKDEHDVSAVRKVISRWNFSSVMDYIFIHAEFWTYFYRSPCRGVGGRVDF